VDGRFRRAVARYHLHPAVSVQPASATGGGTVVALALPGGRRARLVIERGMAALEPSSWHPAFGRSVSTHCVAVVLDEGRARVHIEWDGPP
jgi:hypothetical protein